MKQLTTNRGLLKFIIYSIITLGIYPIVCFSKISTEINYVASKHDHRETMHYCLIYFLFSWLTFGIVPLVWWNNICGRIGVELRTRGIDYSFGAGTFWGWEICGFLIFVGPFIFTYKLLKAMNKLNADYNEKGE